MIVSYKDSVDPGDALEMIPFNAKCIYCGNELHFSMYREVYRLWF